MNQARDKLHLNLFILNTGHHEASWRFGEAAPESAVDAAYYQKLARIAESGKMDSLFVADAYALSRAIKYKVVNGLEPFTLLSALAVATERIGLIATVSTTYNEPFHVARKFSSLDHISGGRAGWNIVTSTGDASALNFNIDHHPGHADRYERAGEFLDVCKGLWDGWSEQALVLDKASGVYADTGQIYAANYKGKHFSVRGPLNLPRSPQCYPVLVQAGSSEYGKEFAAQTAEAIFTAQNTLEEGRSFYADVKARMGKYGREANELKVLPGFSPIIGDTLAEARDKEAELDALTIPEYGLIRLSNLFEFDLFAYPLDEPVPFAELKDVSLIKGQKARYQMYVELARKEKLTIRQLILRTAAGRGHFTMAGTAVQIADEMESWFRARGADGFNVMPPYFPGGLELFVDKVIPELQNRGLFRTAYEGRTLREHLGLQLPAAKTGQLAF